MRSIIGGLSDVPGTGVCISNIRYRETETSWKVSARIDNFFDEAEVLKRFSKGEAQAKSLLLGHLIVRARKLRQMKAAAAVRCGDDRDLIKCRCGGMMDSWPYFGRCLRYLEPHIES